jgi:hypothetical protein
LRPRDVERELRQPMAAPLSVAAGMRRLRSSAAPLFAVQTFEVELVSCVKGKLRSCAHVAHSHELRRNEQLLPWLQ